MQCGRTIIEEENTTRMDTNKEEGNRDGNRKKRPTTKRDNYCERRN